MMDDLVVAAAQVDLDLLAADHNLSTIQRAVDSAKRDHGAHLVVLPELANTGYIKERDKAFGRRFMEGAEKVEGGFTAALGEMAREHDLHIICGMAELHPTIPGTLYNSAVVIGPTGTLLGVHRKAHIPGYEKHYFVPANTNAVFVTDLGTIGVGICYDNQFAELTRGYALKGAELLVMLWNMPSFSNGGSILHNLTSVRAFENRMYAVSCNRTGDNNGMHFFGHSAIADPVGELIACADEADTIISATLQRGRLLEERAQMTIFRDRRPDLYADLVAPL